MMAKLSWQFCCLLLVLFSPLAVQGAVDFTYRTVAKSSDRTPLTSKGETFVSVSLTTTPVISHVPTGLFVAGQAAFGGTTSTGDTVIYTELQGTLKELARTGTQVPGADPGTNYDGFGSTNVSRGGNYAFEVLLGGSAVGTNNNTGIVYMDSVDWSGGLVAQAGGPVPGTLETAGSYFNLRQNNNNTLTVGSFLDLSLNAAFLAITEPAANPMLNLLAMEGETLPSGDIVGFVFGLNVSDNFAIFGRDVSPLSSTEVTTEIIALSLTSSSPIVVARTGDPAVDFPNGELDLIDTQFGLNNHNKIIYGGTVKDASTSAQLGQGLWMEDITDNDPRLLAKIGGDANDLPRSFSYTNFVHVDVNGSDQGLVVADAALQDQPNLAMYSMGSGPAFTETQGIWYENDELELTLAAHTGQQAPDAPEGVTIANFTFPSFNALGQVAFWAGLTGTDVDFSNDAAVFVTDPQGELHMVVGEGNLFDVDDDPVAEDLRTITSISAPASSGGEDGRATSLNDFGQLVLAISFSDFTSGVFVFDTIGPPIPGDFDFDGDVDGDDFFIWQRGESPIPLSASDLADWEANLGSGVTSLEASRAVPEPGTVALLMTTLLLAAASRRRNSK